ncbi:hypothetical protein ZWY2020_053388 [Hordeum vulgare]|nr:hypothetical protein ZWY2020_053388 [Hordeum vulgare]
MESVVLPIEGATWSLKVWKRHIDIHSKSLVVAYILSSRKPFDMILPELGPYTLEYTSNGRYMIVGGRKGHIGMMDMLSMDLIKEVLGNCDVAFLHNEQLLYPYIYNRHGTEIHCLKEHGKALKLQFLDKHFLLASINSFGSSTTKI